MAGSRERPVRLPKDPGSERRTGTRFSLAMEVEYILDGPAGQQVKGSGCTYDLSSSGISFASDRPLRAGQKITLAINWPVLLDDAVRLQLIMSGKIVRANGLVTAVRIRRHEFKTRRVGGGVIPFPKSAP